MAGLKPNNEFDSLESFFNRSLKNASAEPSNGTWMQIEEELNKLEKEKRRRRFLWFFTSGIALLCGLACLWYFMPKDVSHGSAEFSDKTTTENAEQIKSKDQIVERSNRTSETGKEVAPGTPAENVNSKPERPTKVVEQSSTLKIQLGAFKHKADLRAFRKIPYKVIEVNSEDGYTKYYAETNEPSALEKIQEAGFSGAFVKDNYDERKEASIVKSEGLINVARGATPSPIKENGSNTNTRVHPTNIAVSSVNSSLTNSNTAIVKNEAKAETKKTESIAAPSVPENKTTEDAIAANETKTPAKTTIQEREKTLDVPATKSEEIKEAVSTKSDPAVPANPDSTMAIATPVALAEVKSDSSKAKEEKKDSIVSPLVAADAAEHLPFNHELAILLTAGPNIFTSVPQGNAVVTKESQLNTYNGEVKLQYRPFKYFSFSGGLSYSTFSSKQEATSFKFYKYRQEDYQFNSSYGSMAVPMKTMLEGFYFNFPLDSFSFKYAYRSSLQAINVPLEANLHFMNTKWVSLYLGLGANTSIVIGQQAHLSLIKENSTTEFSYNKITANKFNAALMMSLGCDIRITKHWFVTLLPSYKYGLTNISPVNGIKNTPAYFSGNAGVKFKF